MVYIASTVNNIKRLEQALCDTNSDKAVLCQGDFTLKKGYYAILSLNMEFKAIVSKEFFKENFEIGAIAHIKVDFKDGSSKSVNIGVGCYLKDNIEEEEDGE